MANKKHRREFGTGFSHHLESTEPLDLSKCLSVNDMVAAMGKTAFGARQVGEAANILYEMVKDPECCVVLTISGAMTVAKMGLLVCDMIDRKMVDIIVTTGALMAHGLVESTGKYHFKYDTKMNDTELYEAGYNRVYDTLEPEQNLDDVEDIFDKILSSNTPKEALGSAKMCRLLGEYLHTNEKGRGILKSAFEKDVPVFIPAFTDSELGLDFALFNRRRKLNGKAQLMFDPFLDLEHYAEIILKSKKMGIFTIGGGVPRNWAQQVAPYLDLIKKRILTKGDNQKYFSTKDEDPYAKKFSYGVRICPEPTYWGGLSGCTYSEGVSWGKLVPPEDGGKWAEVYTDATIAWPLILKSVIERLEKA